MDMIAIAIAKKNKPTPEQVESAVNTWLDDHPEATTTVEDGSITMAKLDGIVRGAVEDVAEIKADYSELSADVAELKSALDDILDVVYSANLYNPDTATDGVWINPSTHIVPGQHGL